jgi:hypothetical protein
MIQGTQVEERIVDPLQYQQANWDVDNCATDVAVVDTSTSCGSCGNPCLTDTCTICETVVEGSCNLSCSGDSWYLVEKRNYQTRTYNYLERISIVDNGLGMDIDCDCPNRNWTSQNSASIRDGWIYTNFKKGKLYLNYQGMLEDAECNLLVVDHPMLNEYYEYAVKKRVLENLVMNDVPVSQLKIQLIHEGYRTSRNYALSIVNTPNFKELQDVWKANRVAQYAKYYNMFKSYDPRRMSGNNRR